MKKLALFGGLLLGLSLNAQYYWQWGGTTDTDLLYRGEASMVGSTMTSPGHIMSGMRTVTNPPALGMAYDPATATYPFRNQYRFRPSSTSLSSHTANRAMMLELRNGGTAYGMFGSLLQANGTTQGLFYFPLRWNGAPGIGSTNGWIYQPGNSWALEARDVITNANGTTAYILARATSGASSYMYIVSVNTGTGALNWARAYWNVTSSYELQPRKMILNTRTNNLVVVGYINQSGDDDGFIFTTPSATGNSGSFYHYGNAGSSDRLEGIHLGDPTNNFSGGMYVTGRTTTGSGQDTWVMHVNDAPGIANWSNSYDFNGAGGDNYGTDVTERYSPTNGRWEIYVSGNRLASGSDFDMTLLKLKDSGAILAEQGYGQASSIESSLFVEFDETGAPDPGITMFGNTNNAQGYGSWDMTMFRTYFNLETPCDDYSSTPNAGNGPGYLSTNTTQYDIPGSRVNAYMYVVTNFNANICAGAGTDPNGDNSKMAQPGLSLSGHASLGSLEVNLTSMEAAPVKLSLTSMSGQVLLAQSVEASLGDSHFSLEMGSLPAGIYLLTATTGTEQVTKKIIVQ